MQQYDLQIDIDEEYVGVMGRFARAEKALVEQNTLHGLLCAALSKEPGAAGQQPPLRIEADPIHRQVIRYDTAAVQAMSVEALTAALDAVIAEGLASNTIDAATRSFFEMMIEFDQ